jgi:hypothetical protein
MQRFRRLRRKRSGAPWPQRGRSGRAATRSASPIATRGRRDAPAIRCELHIEETTAGEGSFVGNGFVIAISFN